MHQRSYLPYIVFLTGFLFLMILCLQAPVIAPMLGSGLVGKSLGLGHIVIPAIIFTLLTRIVLWLLLGFICHWMTQQVAACFQLKDKHHFNLALGLWLCGVVFVFMLNQVLFPRSLYTDLTATIIPNALAWLLMILSGAIACLAFIVALVQTMRCHGRQFIFMCILFVAFVGWYAYLNHAAPVQTSNRPNIFIIGLDSVRPDYVDYYDGKTNYTPSLDRFFAKASTFTQATTPLARTYPAWVSILTGEYPAHNGARYDLIDPSYVNRSHMLGKILKAHGYYRIYATDETRFSHIDQSYGFDQLITPSLTVNDFLIGNFNDSPIVNFMANTFLGRWLFPYNYANRGDNVRYKPATFLQQINFSMNHVSQQPIFMSIHFCLSHWPYVWANSKLGMFPPKTLKEGKALYTAGLKAVDQQFGEFITYLKTRGLLKNSIIVVISDHGETIGFPGSRVTLAKNYRPKNGKNHVKFAQYLKQYKLGPLDQSWGHGTDLLSFAQNKIIFGWQLHGFANNVTKKIATPVDLIDIKPTILDLIATQDPIHQQNKTIDGVSLEPLINGKKDTLSKRPFYFSSGFSPIIIDYKAPQLKYIVKIAMQKYRVVPSNGRLEMKSSLHQEVLDFKQMAILDGEWFLVKYPSKTKPVWVLFNTQSKLWTDNLDSRFALNSPIKRLQQKVNTFFKPEKPHRTEARS